KKLYLKMKKSEALCLLIKTVKEGKKITYFESGGLADTKQEGKKP
ncbi:1061_t:CDS:1, partial [Dentiscutata erythropus]